MTNKHPFQLHPASRFFLWAVIFITQLLAVSLLAWHLLAQIDFAYPTGYQLLNLQSHIAEFAPHNRFKEGFQWVTPQEHWRLFSEITNAVQHQGKGLTEISYFLPNGTRVPLMYNAEIVHLTDVSNLINQLYTTGIVAGLIWMLLFGVAYSLKLQFPALRHIVLGFCSGILIVVAVVVSLGATHVFYWFHTKIFPDGHQWFFYYEDSLMTTLMKAPDIFAFIALLLLVLLLALWLATTIGMARLLKKSSPTLH